MFAIIATGGKQYRVKTGDQLLIDKLNLPSEKTAAIEFDKVLLVETDQGTLVGTPTLQGASVSAEVLEPLVKGEKLVIFKYKPKKRFRNKRGHRQQYTKVKISKITAPTA